MLVVMLIWCMSTHDGPTLFVIIAIISATNISFITTSGPLLQLLLLVRLLRLLINYYSITTRREARGTAPRPLARGGDEGRGTRGAKPKGAGQGLEPRW